MRQKRKSQSMGQVHWSNSRRIEKFDNCRNCFTQSDGPCCPILHQSQWIDPLHEPCHCLRTELVTDDQTTAKSPRRMRDDNSQLQLRSRKKDQEDDDSQ